MSEPTSVEAAKERAFQTMQRFLLGVEKANLVLIVLSLAIAHLATGFGPIWYGVLAGGLVGLANWRALVWLAGKLARGEKKTRGFYAVLLGSKIVVLLTVVWLLLTFLPVDAIGFAFGISTLMLAVLGMGFKASLSAANADDGHSGQGQEV